MAQFPAYIKITKKWPWRGSRLTHKCVPQLTKGTYRVLLDNAVVIALETENMSVFVWSRSIEWHIKKWNPTCGRAAKTNLGIHTIYTKYTHTAYIYVNIRRMGKVWPYVAQRQFQAYIHEILELKRGWARFQCVDYYLLCIVYVQLLVSASNVTCSEH